MKRSKIALISVVWLLAQISCGLVPTTSSSSPPGQTPISQSPMIPITGSIGSIEKIQGTVLAGPETNQQPVEPSRDLEDNDSVHILDSGKANLDFGHGLVFTLYNDTQVGGTSVNASQGVTSYLSQGGLKGHNPEGQTTEVNLPNGAKISILGTDYFITFDSDQGDAWVYNFDGTVQYSVNGNNFPPLSQHSLLKISSGGVTQIFNDQPFSVEDFDRYATFYNSPILGLQKLLLDLNPALVITPSASNSPKIIATVTSHNVKLREGPDLRFDKTCEADIGSQLTVSGTYHNWFMVAFSDSCTGWVYKDWVSIPPGVNVDAVIPQFSTKDMQHICSNKYC